MLLSKFEQSNAIPSSSQNIFNRGYFKGKSEMIEVHLLKSIQNNEDDLGQYEQAMNVEVQVMKYIKQATVKSYAMNIVSY
jgi:hypothetical protein